MANPENLIPNSQRTPSERRENARKAGQASGRARRKKSNLKKAFELMLTSEIPEGKLKKELDELGLDPTSEQALALSVIRKAISKGDARSVAIIADVTGQNKQLADRQEQKARIEHLKLENDRLAKQLDPPTTQEEKLAEYMIRLQEVYRNDRESDVHEETESNSRKSLE